MCTLVELIEQDQERMNVLSIVQFMNLPDCYVAAGFIRNLVWDALHSCETRLNDIDIVFYDKAQPDNDLAEKNFRSFEQNISGYKMGRQKPGLHAYP